MRMLDQSRGTRARLNGLRDGMLCVRRGLSDLFDGLQGAGGRRKQGDKGDHKSHGGSWRVSGELCAPQQML